MKNGVSVKIGNQVAFCIKEKNKLVWKIGEVTAIFSSREAQRRELIRSKRSGRVLEIKTAAKVYYKACSVCKWPQEVQTT